MFSDRILGLTNFSDYIIKYKGGLTIKIYFYFLFSKTICTLHLIILLNIRISDFRGTIGITKKKSIIYRLYLGVV